MTLGEYIKKYRAEHDLSLRRFTSMCDMSVQYVGNLERGTNNDGKKLSPTMSTIAKIAKGTGISEEELLLAINGTSVNIGLSKRERVLVQKFRALDEAGKLSVEAALDGEHRSMRKVIPLFAASAGPGEPIDGEPLDDYEVDADSKAQFAVKIKGRSKQGLHRQDHRPQERRRRRACLHPKNARRAARNDSTFRL